MNSQTPRNSDSHGLAASVDELLPPLVFQRSEFQPDGPIATLRLELELPARAAAAECAQALVELLHSLNDQDVVLGGKGLAVDQQAQLSGSKLSLVLRPLDVLGSWDRLNQLAETLSVPFATESPGSEKNPVPVDEFMDHVKGCLRQDGVRSADGMTPPTLRLRVSAQVIAA